jgi:hypothetical protein
MATLTSPTIDDLIVDVRTMLGQPQSQNSTWTDEELAQYLNEGVRRYFAEAMAHMEAAFITTTTLDCTANTDTISVPSDFFKAKNLYIKTTTGYDLLSYRNNLTSGYSTTGGGTSSDTYHPDYSFRGRSIVLHDTPNFTSTGGTMITGGDSLTASVSPVFKDLIVMYAVYKAKLRESMSVGVNTFSAALQNLNDLFTAFKEAVSQMSANPTFTVPWNPEDY